MSVSVYKIKKWYKMIAGKSISHVNQGIGTCYSKDEIMGYYNDLTEKVTKDNPNILVPRYHVDTGEKIYFSIGVFQYGLGAYDLYLKTKDQLYKDKVIACANWAVENQQDDGSWITFAYENPDHPYSSMAQGEGISLLIRANIVSGDERYLFAAHKAKDFMLKPIREGGTTEYEGQDVFFYEYTEKPLVLNGWIFSIWGLYDYYKHSKDEVVRELFERSLITLKNKLLDFDIKFWSKYDNHKNICSPFYHKLHIAQLNVMYDLFGDSIYKEVAVKWELYEKSFWKRKKAFLIKALQKIFE